MRSEAPLRRETLFVALLLTLAAGLRLVYLDRGITGDAKRGKQGWDSS